MFQTYAILISQWNLIRPKPENWFRTLLTNVFWWKPPPLNVTIMQTENPFTLNLLARFQKFHLQKLFVYKALGSHAGLGNKTINCKNQKILKAYLFRVVYNQGWWAHNLRCYNYLTMSEPALNITFSDFLKYKHVCLHPRKSILT